MSWTPEIQESLNKVLSIDVKNKIAVFDADGTLWHDDLGESFFKWQIQSNTAPGLKGMTDPWRFYAELDSKSTALSSAWLAKISAGLEESRLREYCAEFYKKHFSSKIYIPVKKLITELKQSGFEIWICTASPRWSIEPCLADLGLTHDRLIGAEVLVDQAGILTEQVVEPVPYAAGKKYWIEKKLKSKPLLVAGNSLGDLEMLLTATHLSLVIIFLPHRPEVRRSEQKLLEEAKQRGWLIQFFR